MHVTVDVSFYGNIIKSSGTKNTRQRAREGLVAMYRGGTGPRIKCFGYRDT